MQALKYLAVLVLLAVVLAFGVLFSVQNVATAPLDLLIIQFSEQKVALWVLAAFALGGVLGIMVSSVAIMRLKARIMLLQRKLKKANKDHDSSSLEPVKSLSTAGSTLSVTKA